MSLLKAFEKRNIDLAMSGRVIPDFKPGDTLKVNIKIKEGTTERVQVYEGVCIARSSRGIGSNFTVRKISYGIGVERCFILYSPLIASIDVVKRGVVRRAKLYYMRELQGKSARIRERIVPLYTGNNAAPHQEDAVIN